VNGAVGALQALQADRELETLSRALEPGRPAPPWRQGIVQAVAGTNPPVYTVTVGGTDVPVRSLGVGALPGDSVFVAQNDVDWAIVGVGHTTPRVWTPIAWGSSGNPTIGTGAAGAVAEGSYRMVGPTSMWFSFRIVLGTDASGGAGFLGVDGFPLPSATETAFPVFVGTGASGNARYGGVGTLGVAQTLCTRIAVGNGGLGLSKTSPGTFGPGGILQGSGVIEVQF
jgi:hypothetical protein